jgi:hypothetical protein
VAVAGRRGADTFQKHTWTELPAETTLRAVGRFICPDGELLHVETRKDIDGELSEFAGGMLDRDLAFVVGVARMQFLKCCFAVDQLAAELKQDGKKGLQGHFKAMMDDKRRHTMYHWPEPYAESSDKNVIRQIANNIIAAGTANSLEYGGFSTSSLATSSRPRIWALVEVLYAIVPRSSALANRGMAMPELFLHAAETPWIESTDAPKPVRDEDGYHEQLAGYVRKLRNITNDPACFPV